MSHKAKSNQVLILGVIQFWSEAIKCSLVTRPFKTVNGDLVDKISYLRCDLRCDNMQVFLGGFTL